MFHFLVSYNGWAEDADSIDLGRCFEYTSDELLRLYKPRNQIDLQKIRDLPALLVSEVDGSGPQVARFAKITGARVDGRLLHFDYVVDSGIPQISNQKLQALERELGIDSFEFSRTHWSIKNADLFRVLYKSHLSSLPSPKVFRLDAVDGVDETLVSLMMPFDARFNDVHSALVGASADCGMQCLRADNIWDHDSVIQDVVSLIARSRVVICDCSGRNANVFYEAGIAHSAGKDVILITQNEADVPFDLQHLRFVPYLNNVEGLQRLRAQISSRINTLRQRLSP
jgi:hypothetical protein